MSILSNKKKLLIIIAAVIVAVAAVGVALWFMFPWLFTFLGVPQDKISRGKYTGFDVVVVARDTDDSVLDELDSYHIDYVEYEKGRVLLGDGGIIGEDDINGDAAIYLCAGKYDAQVGDFIIYSGKHSLKVCGDGTGKTKIVGGSRIYDNNGTAISVFGNKLSAVSGSQINGVSISGFKNGIHLKYADKTVIKDVDLQQNHYTAILFENAVDSDVSACNIENNGNPETSDTGYGISLLYASKNNKVDAIYKNNANNNAVDFPQRAECDLPKDNTLKLKMTYDLTNHSVPIRDKKEEAQNAKPTSASQKFEMEKARIDNTGAVLSTSTEKVKPYSGSGWIFLFNTKITLDIDVKEAGNYRIFVVGTSDDGNNKCDYFQVNGGTKYLTSFMGNKKGEWQMSQPGTEYWENNELHPTVQTNGFELNAGKNTIEITANWGYCCYDSIIIEKIG